MSVRFEVRTMIAAPAERAFDHALSVEDHLASMARSGEHVLAVTTPGALGLGDEVRWSGRHFGITWTMRSRITELTRPERFVDEQVRGPFAWFRHEHRFWSNADCTQMVDVIGFAAPLGPLGRFAEAVVLGRYLRHVIEHRAAYIRDRAETAAR